MKRTRRKLLDFRIPASIKRDPPKRQQLMDEQEFKTEADRTLNSLYKKLAAASDESDFETDLSSGALVVEFDDPPAKFVISPNTPVRQIWVSAHSRSFKLDWSPGQRTFVLNDTGETLTTLIQGAIAKQLGQEIAL
jgi:iron donor protein CyaY